MPKSDFVPDPFFRDFSFHFVIDWPKDFEVYDFTSGYDADRPRSSEYGIGRYNEHRKGMYTTDLFDPNSRNAREIHIGLDLSAPAGAPVYAFYSGIVYMTAINPAAGDYGGTIITEHQLGSRKLWALYGHLSHASVTHRAVGSAVTAGDRLGWLGSKDENGGWNPHLHFQLSWLKPSVCDMPGAVNKKDRDQALRDYPDPRNVVGELY